jgi:hypothetical protein
VFFAGTMIIRGGFAIAVGFRLRSLRQAEEPAPAPTATYAA